MFAVLAQSQLDLVGLAIQQQYPNDSYFLAEGQWILVSEGTPQTVCMRLGIQPGGPLANAVVLSFSNYWGAAVPDFWEWLATKMGGQQGAA
jgi:hypothetical protein